MICDVRMAQTRGKSESKTDFVVEKVVEHRPAIRGLQMRLPMTLENDKVKITENETQ